MDAYLLIGNPHTRKSSLLRSLTGCFNRSVRDIERQQGGALRLYVRVAALQESRTAVDAFLDEAQRSRCPAVAFSLWPEANPLDPERYPSADRYLDRLRAAGWQFRRIAVLGAHPYQPRLPGVARFPNVLTQPINATAHGIRQHFEWR